MMLFSDLNVYYYYLIEGAKELINFTTRTFQCNRFILPLKYHKWSSGANFLLLRARVTRLLLQ